MLALARYVGQNKRMERMSRACPYCGAVNASGGIEVREHHLGLKDAFRYLICDECGSIFIANPQIDLSPYYPVTYYSYGGDRKGPLGHLDRFAWELHAKRFLSLFRGAGAALGKESEIVDVGSGAGHLLRALRRLGYHRTTGIDPYLDAGVGTNGITVIRENLDAVVDRQLVKSADAIMFHHSLEHVAEPAIQLRNAAKLLRPAGSILVRIPVAAYAWERYREYWWGLDAPRHLAIPTEQGMKRLAERVGLECLLVRYDSSAMQFLVSEVYARGDSLLHAFRASPPRTALRMITSIPQQIRARKLNAQQRGDQAAFVLRARS